MKKKKDIHKKQVFMIEATPYGQQCVVVINGKFKDIEDWFKKYATEKGKRVLEHIEENRNSYEEEDANNLGRLYQNFPIGFAMTINTDRESWIETVGLVAHECFHLTSYIFRRVGIDLTIESEEAFTYLQQNLITQILRKIY